MSEKLILMHENTPYFKIFPFLKPLGGAVAPPPPWRRPWSELYQEAVYEGNRGRKSPVWQTWEENYRGNGNEPCD